VLGDVVGIRGFHERVAGLAEIRLVQQGGELAYLLLHDPEFRRVRRDDLVEVGRRVRLKQNIDLLSSMLDGCFYVVSAAPQEVIQSALEGLVPEDHIFGTQFRYDPGTGEIQSIARVPAGYGKVAVVDELRARLGVASNRIVYIGDGSSDVHVMLHVNRLDGMTIAVSENRYITQIARRTVLGEDALSVLVPILEEIAGLNPAQVRCWYEQRGFVLREWDKVRTDSITIARAVAEVA
jgi:hypothetical protein